MTQFADHPLRYALANELHARPFPALKAPCLAACIAIKQPEDAANRDRAADRAHLVALLDRFGAAHPQPDATHYSGAIGRHVLKWESHTEFVTYSVFSDGLTDRPFDPAAFDVFPKDWLENAPGQCISALQIRIERHNDEDDDAIVQKMNDWFVPESLACAQVLDDSAIAASDFRIDSSGQMRFALFVRPETGVRRVGRIAQRLVEIEIYRSMSMMGLPRARALSNRMGGIDGKLTGLVGDMAQSKDSSEETLDALLSISADLENNLAQASFRFSATVAYEAIVNQRIEVLREERFRGFQTFREFMMRRFEPAMRTISSTERRLQNMTERAIRAGGLLRTRVDVTRSAQNQSLLESMDRRADLQLRLQHTVEGLSVVAISYYAVSLVGYLLYPVAGTLGLSKGLLLALITLPVVFAVWLMVRRIRKKMG